MEQELKTIYEFKKGDSITRLKDFINELGYRDFTLVGVKLTFQGIANGCVYLLKKDFIFKFITGRDEIEIKIPVDICEQGWSYYVEPDFLNTSADNYLSPIEVLQNEINISLEKEDYRNAGILTKKLEQLKSNGNNQSI